MTGVPQAEQAALNQFPLLTPQVPSAQCQACYCGLSFIIRIQEKFPWSQKLLWILLDNFKSPLHNLAILIIYHIFKECLGHILKSTILWN